jgi:hypothetical protein
MNRPKYIGFQVISDIKSVKKSQNKSSRPFMFSFFSQLSYFHIVKRRLSSHIFLSYHYFFKRLFHVQLSETKILFHFIFKHFLNIIIL